MISRRNFLSGTAFATLIGVSGYWQFPPQKGRALADQVNAIHAESNGQNQTNVTVEPWAEKLVNAATAQIGVTTHYDPSYVGLSYPMGDIPRGRGVCTDVIIRAYRDAFGIDLQN